MSWKIVFTKYRKAVVLRGGSGSVEFFQLELLWTVLCQQTSFCEVLSWKDTIKYWCAIHKFISEIPYMSRYLIGLDIHVTGQTKRCVYCQINFVFHSFQVNPGIFFFLVQKCRYDQTSNLKLNIRILRYLKILYVYW